MSTPPLLSPFPPSSHPLLDCYHSCCHVQVLEVVRSNYDTLTLKLQDGLDYFEKYSERPKESGFFAQLVSCALHMWGVGHSQW